MDKILLIGNPNTGKSTLFNTLTKSNAHTGNWHGVTVDEQIAEFKIDNSRYTLVDLPGIYSLSPNSYEEQYSIDYILNNPTSPIICVASSLSLKRNLLLCIELLMLNRKVILIVNKMDNYEDINIKKLQNSLKINVVELNAKNKKTTKELLNLIKNEQFLQNKIELQYNKKLDKFKSNLKSQNPLDFFVYKAFCGDEYYINKLQLNSNQIKLIDENFLEKTTKEKYNLIDNILKQSNYSPSKIVGKSKLDKILLNKFLCIPIFLIILLTVFYLTFFSVGAYISNGLRYLIQDVVGSSVVNFLNSNNVTMWLVDLIDVGLFGGVGTIISFLPQVALLFLFLDLLEQSGYISRLAFCLDDTLKYVGLSGKSVYTLLMGFGCSTTASLTARNMSDKNAKIKTAMLAPYMSCSAKLPVYAVIGGAFFGATNVFIIVLLYFLGVIIALLLSLFFERTYLKSSNQTFLMEFPSYQKIDIKQVLKTCLNSCKSFIVRVGSLLLGLSIIVWILENFSFGFSYVKLSGSKSMLQSIGEVIAPVFIPLGFSSWGTASALLAGLVAKEIIVSSIAIFNKVNIDSENFMQNVSHSLTEATSAVFLSPASALSFMVFCLLYSPCVATISVLRKEIGKKWTIISIILQFSIAYATSLVVYNIFRLTEVFGILTVTIVAILSIILITMLLAVIRRKHKKISCLCTYCNKNCNIKNTYKK